jgi:[ribosomal protein S18]-alanine N-acetyltransferase
MKVAVEAIRIDPMQAEDLDEVLRIEAASFSEPWTREMFQAELLPSVSLALVVRSAEGAFLGYFFAAVLDDIVHISNIAVDPRVRGRGIGKALLRVALTQAAERGARTATLEVRASNDAAQALYRHYGFTVVGRRRRYYTAPVEDALIMCLDPLDVAAPVSGEGEKA